MTRWTCQKCGSVDPIPEPDTCPVCFSYGYGCDCILPDVNRCPNCREDN